MPRPPRLDAPGVTHHVTIRGIDGRDIFGDDRDRLEFLRRLHSERADAGFACLAWALMSNHVHLILRTGSVPLSKYMQRLNGGYAIAFNRRHLRRGYLLQDRFHSSVIDDDAYLSVAVRYVFLNPVRAGLVRSVAALSSFPWTGYSELTGKYPRGIIDVDEVFEWLAPGAAEVGAALLYWMSALEEVDVVLSPSNEGPRAVAENAHRPALESDVDAVPRGVRVAKNRARGWTLDALIAWTAAMFRVSERDLRCGRRSADEARARAVIAAFANSELGLDLKVVAAATGVTGAGISRASRRGGEIVRTDQLYLPTFPPE